MALIPQLAMANITPDFLNTLQRNQQMAERSQMMDIRGKQEERAAQNQQYNVAQAQQDLMIDGLTQVVPMLEAGNTQGAIDALGQFGQRHGGLLPQGDLDEYADLIKKDPAMALNQGKMWLGQFGGISKSAGQREFDALIANMSPEDQEKAKRIKLGLDARAVSSADLEAANLPPELKEMFLDFLRRKEGAKETGTLTARKELLPEVQAAVTSATNIAKDAAKQVGTNKSNTRALEVYELAMTDLVSKLDETWTGPFVSAFPALSSNAQSAEGAIAAMAPILKSMFRSAGEGNFTDQDQKLLMNMVPTRSDRPEAISAKLQSINAIVRSKLAPTETSELTGLSDNAKKYLQGQ